MWKLFGTLVKGTVDISHISTIKVVIYYVFYLIKALFNSNLTDIVVCYSILFLMLYCRVFTQICICRLLSFTLQALFDFIILLHWDLNSSFHWIIFLARLVHQFCYMSTVILIIELKLGSFK